MRRILRNGKQVRFQTAQRQRDRAFGRMRSLGLCLCAALAQMSAGPASADSATGVDTVLGNALNPGPPGAPIPYDPEAGLRKRSPSGWLYGFPYVLREERQTAEGGWEYTGWGELGGLVTNGDTGAAQFKTYSDLQNGFLFNNFGARMNKPDTAQFVELEGGGVGRDDQFYGMQFGRYNDWRVRLFYNETPHVFTTTYRSLWDGVGTGNLTLAATTPQLVAGGGNVATGTVSQNIRTALTTVPDSELGLVRKKAGANFGMTLSETWKAYANYSYEKREGSRPFGASFGAGGQLSNIEIPETINYATQEMSAGVRYSDALQSFNAQLSASLFRNDTDTLTFENPMTIQFNGVSGLSPGTFTIGRYALVPNNDFYQARAEYARSFPELYQSRFTGVVSASSSRQNDALIAPTPYSLAGGTSPSTGTSLTDHWNTTSANSRTNAEAKIDALLVDLGWSARPLNPLNLTAKVRYYETQNDTNYQSCNPLTGEWGRILNDGSAALLTGPSLVNGNNPPGTAAPAYNASGCNLGATQAQNLVPNAGNTPIASIPYDYTQINYRLTGDYMIGKASSVVATLEREQYDRSNRERENTWENIFRLEYANRGFESATLRASYTYGQRRGSDYISDPSRDYTSYSLGPLPTANGTDGRLWLRTISSFRKYDVADRDNNLLNASFNMALLTDLDGGISGQWKDSSYPNSSYGRTDHEQRGSVNVNLNYQPSPALGAYGYYSWQTGKMSQSGIQNNLCTLGTPGVAASSFQSVCGDAGGPLFPLERAWTVNSNDTNNVAGLGLRYDFDKALLDLNYTYSHGRTRISYEYGPGIPLSPADIALAGSGLPDLTFIQSVLQASLLVPITRTFAVRFYYAYDNSKISDWHYDGVQQNPVPANGAVYLDSGPQNARVTVYGLFVRVTL